MLVSVIGLFCVVQLRKGNGSLRGFSVPLIEPKYSNSRPDLGVWLGHLTLFDSLASVLG